MKTIRYELDAAGIATLTFDEPGSPVNTMCLQWQEDLSEAAALVQVDARVADAAQLRDHALAWIAAHPTSIQPWDDKAWKIPGGTPTNPKIASALTVAPAMLRKTTRGLYPAPEAALAVMVEGAMVDF